MRGRTRSVLLGLLVAVVVAPLAAVPAHAEEPLLWGAHPNPRAGESREVATQRIETAAGRRLGAVRLFYQWDSPWPTAYENGLRDGGRTLVVSVRSRRSNGTDIPWADVASARPGSALHTEMVGWAARVRDFGAPVYITFNHEPETQLNIGLGTATDYLAAWRAWVAVFREQGVTNVRFMWIMTDQSFWLPAADRRAAARWYPGDEWVDAIAGDAYNWFTCRPGIVNAWKPLRDIIDPQRRFWLEHRSEELWLAEYGTVEDPADPGRKARWFADAQALFRTPEFAVFDGVMLFEPVPSSPCRWAADTSPTAAAAWRAWGADAFYGGTVEPAPERTAALVVGNVASPGVDAALADRLRAQGYEVTLHDDATVAAADVAGSSVVLVAQSVGPAQLGTRLRDVARPVVIWKASLYDEMRMSPANGGTVDRTAVTVTAPADPLAAGRTGAVTVVTATSPLPHGGVATGAAVVATLDGRPTLFAYRTGAPMVGGMLAPACRIAFPLPSAGVSRLTPDGLTLLDRAVEHAATGCV
ncbi:MAG: hypothetical protein NTW05_28595 [Pseudonocardiales bacterium]|nr:hypothetical protein [Pseudonocardiales bacterium]